ncbi:MAG: hypothetical protein KDC85_22525 [Saprospiraceae bacterium]|nr:hypothetical protein [Saprospiraceae bacterium]MCB9324567.1 hypothetical protein [Lewinellaceae bacterium]
MKNLSIIKATIFFFCFTISSHVFAQQPSLTQRMRTGDLQKLNTQLRARSFPQASPRQRVMVAQQPRVIVPQQRPQRQVYYAPRPNYTQTQSTFSPMPNFGASTNQALAQANQLIVESKKMMQDAMPAVRQRQLEYQSASPQRRMQMDAEKRYILQKAQINMNAHYGADWVKSFDPSAKVVYIHSN